MDQNSKTDINKHFLLHNNQAGSLFQTKRFGKHIQTMNGYHGDPMDTAYSTKPCVEITRR